MQTAYTQNIPTPLSRYERCAVISERVDALSKGAHPRVERTGDGYSISSLIRIAQAELEAGLLSYTLIRTSPTGIVERVSVPSAGSPVPDHGIKRTLEEEEVDYRPGNNLVCLRLSRGESTSTEAVRPTGRGLAVS